MPDILVMTQVTPLTGRAAAAIAAIGELVAWEVEQPGFVWGDVLADPKNANAFWPAERWVGRGTARSRRREAAWGGQDFAR